MIPGPYNPYNPVNQRISASEIEGIVGGYKVRTLSMFQTAMVHSSYVKREDVSQLAPCPTDCLDLFEESYDRLEHLGDSIVGAVATSYLFERFPTEQEGFLTDLRKEIVCNDNLGVWSTKIGLAKYLVISRHNEERCEGRSNLKKLGDIFEAFVGALWLDSAHNFPLLYTFIVRLIETYVDIPNILLNNRNFKEQFQRVYQAKYHTTPIYTQETLENGLYCMAVRDSENTLLGTGTASTKKQAEQWAAREALEKWQS